MKKTLILAASALSMVSAPAFAQATSDIQLSAQVAGACGTGNHLSGATQGAGDQTDITVDLDDANGQFKTAASFNRSFGNVWCNGPASLTMTATPLTTNVAVLDQGSFTNRFDIEVSGGAMIYLGGGSLSTATAGTSTKTFANPAAFETGLGQYSSVDIKVLPTLTAANTAERAVAGTYSGSVVLTATPAS